MPINWKKLLPAGAAIAVFILLSFAYFSPVLDGKKLRQGDIRNFIGGSRDIVEFREAYGEEPLWTASMFSGMPAYQISVKYGDTALTLLHKLFTAFLPAPVSFLFLYMLGMYILLRCLRVDAWLALVGALAYGFSSYFFVILEAGHNSKALAVGYMPMVLGGFYLLMRGDKLLGAALFALSLALMVWVNHVQVTYYLGIVLVLFALAETWRALREKTFSDVLKRFALAVPGVVLALACNVASLWATYEYGRITTRSPSELTIEPDGSSAKANQTSGLDRDYVTQWSYGKQESFSLIVADAKGGASGSVIQTREDLAAIKDPAFKQEITKVYQEGRYVNSYWGDQDFTSGPVYIGVIVALLLLLLLAQAEGNGRWWALLSIPVMVALIYIEAPVLAGLLVIAYLLAGIFLWKDTLGYALFAALFLTLLLSWGHNLMPLTDFFLDHVPGYDKFRAVTIILVIVELCAPVLAVLYVQRLLNEGPWDKAQQRRFLVPAGALLLIMLGMALLPDSLFTFFSDKEKAELADGSQTYIDGLKELRIGLFTADVWRSIGFLLAGAALVFAFGKRWVPKPALLAGLGVLILFDLWMVDRRYLNNDKDDRGQYLSWEDEAKNKSPFKPTKADLSILQREQNAATEADFAEAIARLRAEKQKSGGSNRTVSKDDEAIERFGSLRRTTNFRVLTLANPTSDARVSYFHRSMGGYHGAKLKRYQELLTFHILPEMQALVGDLQKARTLGAQDSAFIGRPALNMLNMRYLLAGDDNPAIRNDRALGNAWFVDEVRIVKSADEEITALGKIDPQRTAVVDERYTSMIDASKAHPDSTASVALKLNKLNEMVYSVKSSNGGVVVFSEIFYDADWHAEIDGKAVPHARVDYVLRGLAVPAGEHEVRFFIKSKPYETGRTIASVSSWLLLLLLLGALALQFRKQPGSGAYGNGVA